MKKVIKILKEWHAYGFVISFVWFIIALIIGTFILNEIGPKPDPFRDKQKTFIDCSPVYVVNKHKFIHPCDKKEQNDRQ